MIVWVVYAGMTVMISSRNSRHLDRQCAQHKDWWRRAKYNEHLPGDPEHLSRPLGSGNAAYLACKHALLSKIECKAPGQWLVARNGTAKEICSGGSSR